MMALSTRVRSGLLSMGLARMASATLQQERDSQTTTLADGRTLGWAEYGSSIGPPLVFLHGFPSSRLEPSGIASVATRHGVRLIAPDRPGFGLSTFHAYTIPSYASDIASSLDRLGIERAALVGGSGGGPFALVCAASIPHRLSAVGLVACAPPWDARAGLIPAMSRWGRAVTYNTSRLARLVFGGSMRALRWFTGTRYAVEYLDALLARTISDKPAEQRREQLLRVLFEWCAQGPAAAVHEANLLSEDWGIDFASIAMPVQAWHGVEDARAPIRAIRWMLERMPNSSRSELPGEHFDIHKNLTRCLKPWWRSTRRVSLGHSLARRLHSDAVLIHVPQLQQGGSYMATLFYCVEWGTTDLDLDLQHS